MRRAAQVAVLGVMASGLLSLTAIGQAASPVVSPTLSPPEGQTAVSHGDTLTIGGIVESGSTLVHAELRFRDAAGDPAREPMESTHFVSIQGGSLVGERALSSLCPDAATVNTCLERLRDGYVLLAVTVEHNGDRATGLSNLVRLDLVRPHILRTSLVGPGQIEVKFNEPVRLTGPVGDSQMDWILRGDCRGGLPPLSVDTPAGDRSVRLLNLAVQEDEDPRDLGVYYCPGPNRETYKDGANNSIASQGRMTLSLDRVAPKVPVISAIAGRPSNNAVANDPSPWVTLNGLRPGHYGQVYLESSTPAGEPSDGFQRTQDTFLGQAEAGPSGVADVKVNQILKPDGTYTFYGVARDRATCTSGGTQECPNYSGGSPAQYTLDTVVPLPLFAATDGPEVLVRFSEPVSGTDDPSQWTVQDTLATGVSGGGEERVVSVTPDARANALVTWTPPATGAYADAAGNQVAGFSTQALDYIPPVITVADPLTAVWTAQNSYPVTGSVSKPGSTVQALDGDGEAARDELGPAQTEFAIDVPLKADQPHNLTLRATDSLGNVNRQDTLLPSITQDSTAPTLSVVSPTNNNVLAGGTTFTIEWQAADANFGADAIDIDWSADGTGWDPVAHNQSNSGQYSWTVPSTSTEQAQIRIRAEDRVGFAAEALSELFAIDFERPTFDALTVDNRSLTECPPGRPCVFVHFTEAMQGSVKSDEWLIDGVPANNAIPFGMGSITTKTRKILLETIPAQELEKNQLPEITYDPHPEVPDNRTELRDEAGNTVPDNLKTVDAGDGILPLVPAIEEINGQPAGDTVTSDEAAPQILVGGMDRDDTAEIYLDDGNERFDPEGDLLVGSARTTGAAGATNGGLSNESSSALVTIEPFRKPGEYLLYAAARDPGKNISEGADQVLYRLENVVFLPTPVIEQIAGRSAGAPVKANNPAPEVKVGNIASGLDAVVFAESDGQAGWTAGDRQVGRQTAGAEGALVQTAALGADATYTLYAAARDAKHWSAAADAATYILDTANPAFTAAVADERRVLVTFDETVAGLSAEAEWRIDGLPANTTTPAGMTSGLTKLQLETLPSQTISPTASPQITYSPAGGSADPARTQFRDEAGNDIEVRTVNAAAKGTQPVPVPPGTVPPSGQQPKPGQGGQPAPGTGGTLCDILGTAGNDILLGTDGDDVICGGQGADVIRSGAGADMILGQEGNDVLRGGAGNDDLRGGADKDSLFGEAGADALRGDAGVDRLSGGPGKDRLDGGPSKDRCAGGPGVTRKRRC